jgi:hypothetical protein
MPFRLVDEGGKPVAARTPREWLGRTIGAGLVSIPVCHSVIAAPCGVVHDQAPLWIP